MNKSLTPLVIGVLAVALAISAVILLSGRFRSSRESVPPTEAAATIVPAAVSPTTSSETASDHAFENIQLAWFYKPPEKDSLPILAENFDVFILTHKDEQERDALKSLGVKAPIFLYLQLLEIENPGSCSKTPQGNQVAYQAGDFCEISEQHPDWFLLDQNGNRIVDNESVYMDPGHAEYRAFWLERARALQEQYHWDGFFIDNLEASLSKISIKGIVPAKYPDDASYQAAIEGFLKYLRDNYFNPRRQPVLANIISARDWKIWLHYLQYLDGAMIEAFAVDWSNDFRSPSNWEGQMDAVEEALSRGKSLILVSQAEQPEANRQQFALASYLLIANDNASFRYADSDGYREVSLYENYFLDLGQPLGPRYKKGSSWQRDFTHGQVLVDPGKQRAEIKLCP